MQHSFITLEVYFRKVWKLLLQRLHNSNDIRVKTCVRIILGHPICTYIVCPIAHIRDGAEKITDDARKAETLNRAFARKFSPRRANQLPNAPDYQLGPLLSFCLTDVAVRNMLLSITPHKACGPDGLSARVIRECAELTAPLTTICKLSPEQGVVPRAWKRANILPIDRRVIRTIIDPYRCCLCLAKFPNALSSHHCTYSHVKLALHIEQHGFMPKRFCVSNLACMLHEAWGNISDGGIKLTFTPILVQLFTVWTMSCFCIIWVILSKYLIGLSSGSSRFFFTDRMQRVVVNRKCSSWSPVLSGTPEGSILSPL